MAKNKRKTIVWNVVDMIVLLIQLVCSAMLAYLVKDLLPRDYWVIVIGVLLVFLAAFSMIFTVLSKRIRRKNKGKAANVCFVLLSLLLSFALLYVSSVVKQGLHALDEVADVSYQTHELVVSVEKDSSVQALSELNGKKVGVLEGMDEKVTQKALEEISNKENTTFEKRVYDTVFELYQALIAGEIDAMLVDDAYCAVLEEMISDYTDHIREIYRMEIQVEIDLSEAQDPDADDSSDKNVPEIIYPTEDDTDPTQTPENEPYDPVVTEDTFNIFISGIDTYGSVSKVSRSDVNMIVTVNPKTKQILLTSIPRDYYVVLGTKGAYDKLTHAGIYGVQESVATLENLFGIQIDYYIKVNFTSLIKIVDTLGGISVDNPNGFTSSHNGEYYPVGTIQMNGEKALAYVRERYAFATGDNMRVQNQQRVLIGIINKAISPAIIKNYSNVMSAVSGSFVTNLSTEEIQSLIQMQLSDMSAWDIQQVSVTGSNSSSSKCYSMKGYSVYVMQPNYSSVKEATNKIRALY